jgi:cell division protein FtsZ
MSINLSMPEPTLLHPRILVIGVGGAGGNAVNNMIDAKLQGVDFVVANTDSQALAQSKAERKIQLGGQITQGLGAGSKPEVGRAAAEESLEQLVEHMSGAHMVFVTAGMGGGTGTGAAPVIAQLARERDILTVGVVTKPFQFEGGRRMAIAEDGILELQQYVDTQIVIPNQNLFRIANEKTTFSDAFAMADEVLHSGVRGVTDLMVMPGLINLDFADVRTVMAEMGKAVMGTGESDGEDRATEAAQAAISNPLLDDLSITGAQGVLINITGGMDMTLFEVDEAADHIRKEVDPEANIIVGSTFSEDLTGRIRVSVVATGLDAAVIGLPRTAPRVTTLHTPARVLPTAPVETVQPGLQVGAGRVPADPPALAPTAEARSASELEANQPEASELEPAPFDLATALTAAGEAKESDDLPVDGIGDVLENASEEYEEEVSVEMEEAPTLDTVAAQQGPSDQAEAHILREVLKSQSTAPQAPEAHEEVVERPSVRSSLFARVTGVGRSRSKAAELSPRRLAAATIPPSDDIREVPVSSSETPKPIEPARASVNFAEVTPTERLAPSAPEEDQLEIPAFLRRQAN